MDKTPLPQMQDPVRFKQALATDRTKAYMHHVLFCVYMYNVYGSNYMCICQMYTSSDSLKHNEYFASRQDA